MSRDFRHQTTFNVCLRFTGEVNACACLICKHILHNDENVDMVLVRLREDANGVNDLLALA